jgi:hypothetical protein
MVSGVFKAAIASGFVAISNLLTGCDSSAENPPPITAEQLLELRPLNQLVPLVSLVKINPNSTLCILDAYEDRVPDHFHNAKLINDYLASIGYVGSEGQWLIIWVVDGSVSFTRGLVGSLSLYPMEDLEHRKLTEDSMWDGIDDFYCSVASETFLYRVNLVTVHTPEGWPGIVLLRRSAK